MTFVTNMGKLSIIPTPIGNLKDISLRALEVLKTIDLLLAEDTRTTGKLLKEYAINMEMKAFHMHNEHKLALNIAETLSENELHYGLVSDAGMPGVSDPAFLLVRRCIEQNVEIDTLPGSTAFLPALINSGLPTDRFCFEGFLPHKKGRNKRLKQLVDEERTMVFYESPHRLLKSLNQFTDFFEADRQISVSREISKLHEETIRGTISELIAHFENIKPKGEIVIILNGKK